MKYLDLVAYPATYFAVYALMGLINWNSDPETWSIAARVIWIIWGTVWGMALQYRTNTDLKAKSLESPSNPC